MDLGFFTEKFKNYVFMIKSCLLLRKCKLYGNILLGEMDHDLVNRNSYISISLHAKYKQKEFFLSHFQS